MLVTKIILNFGSGDALAYATVVFEDSFLVSGIKIIRKDDGGLAIIMPSKKSVKGKLHSVCHPTTQTFNSYLEEKIYQELDQKARNFDAMRSPRGLPMLAEYAIHKQKNNGDIGVPTTNG